MRQVCLLISMLCVLAVPADAASKLPPIPPKLIDRIDSLIATEIAGRITIEAKGAVGSGGWRAGTLRPVKSGPGDQHTIVVQFVATPPPPNRAVIMGLVPVAASTTVRFRPGIVSVRVMSGSNEITTQILK